MLAAIAASSLLALWAPAATLTWDPGNTGNGATIDPADGVWNTTAGNTVWNNAGANVAWTQTNATTPLNSAVFGGADGVYAVTVGTALATSGLTFSNSGYTLSAATPQTITDTGGLSAAGGVSATIGSNVTVAYTQNAQFLVGNSGAAGTITIAAGATVSKTGTNNLAVSGTGAVVNVNGTFIRTGNGTGSNSFRIGAVAGDMVTVNINPGGTLTHNSTNNRIEIGQGGEGTVNVLGGTMQTLNGGAILVGASGTKGTLNVVNGIVTSIGDIVIGNVAEGVLNLAGGSTSITGTSGQRLVLSNNGPGTVTLSGTGSLSIAGAGINFGSVAASTGAGILNLDGGTLTTPQINKLSTAGSSSATFNFNGGTLKPSASNANFMSGLTSAVVKAGGAIVDTNGFNIAIGQDLTAGAPSGGLTKLGAGVLTLGGLNSYTGATNVSAGTLQVTGIISGSATAVQSGGTLAGSGTLDTTTVISGGTLAPGVSGLGTMFFATDLTLGGTALFEINKNGLLLSNDAAVVTGTLNLGGNLTLVASGDPLALGDSFNLFDAGTSTGQFASYNLPTLDPGLAWDTAHLSTDGTIAVVPEPGTVIAIWCGLGVLAACRAHRQKFDRRRSTEPTPRSSSTLLAAISAEE